MIVGLQFALCPSNCRDRPDLRRIGLSPGAGWQGFGQRLFNLRCRLLPTRSKIPNRSALSDRTTILQWTIPKEPGDLEVFAYGLERCFYPAAGAAVPESMIPRRAARRSPEIGDCRELGNKTRGGFLS